MWRKLILLLPVFLWALVLPTIAEAKSGISQENLLAQADISLRSHGIIKKQIQLQDSPNRLLKPSVLRFTPSTNSGFPHYSKYFNANSLNNSFDESNVSSVPVNYDRVFVLSFALVDELLFFKTGLGAHYVAYDIAIKKNDLNFGIMLGIGFDFNVISGLYLPLGFSWNLIFNKRTVNRMSVLLGFAYRFGD